MSAKKVQSAIQKALSYPLIEALANRRSRRFSLGAAIPGGGLQYQSRHAPVPLSKLEEAMLAFAAAGLNGFCLADLPYAEGAEPETGGGNIMASLIGRTGASADAVHSTTLIIINDEGTYLLKRPQDHTLAEIDELCRLAQAQEYEAIYDRLRVQINSHRTSIPRAVPHMLPFNKWSTNLPGSTYFLPVCDLTGMTINVALSMFDEQAGMFMVDDRHGLRPAGIARFGKSRGGKLNDDFSGDRIMPILNFENGMAEFMLAEQAFMGHSLSLMEQAMGLGGWTHLATSREVSWFEALGFTMKRQKFTQVAQTNGIMKWFLDLVGAEWPHPHPLGLNVLGVDFIKPFCPPYYPSMEAAVLAYIDEKKRNFSNASLQAAYSGTWQDPPRMQRSIAEFSDTCIETTIAYCTYIYETYGRFPAHFGPMRSTLAHQAHHLDLEFYDRFYQPGAYTETQATHMADWHG